jgi:hypothetical protein
MAVNKNQHFVPRCHLKPFTGGGKGKAINLFNVDLAKSIPVAPVKGQCSGDYFYGDDLKLEKALQAFEGEYATCLASVCMDNYQLTDADARILRRFWLLQNLRTESACLTAVQIYDQMEADLGELPPGYKLSIKEAVQIAMRAFFEQPDLVDDLEVRLVQTSPRPSSSPLTTRPSLPTAGICRGAVRSGWHPASRAPAPSASCR